MAEKMEGRMALLGLELKDRIAILTLRRPDKMNALGLPGDGDEFAEICKTINANTKIRCVVLTGEGRAFSAGGDLKAMQEKSGAFAGGAIALRNSYRSNIHNIVRSIYGLEVPAIAAVNGPAIGLGCDLACMCDLRIAADTAKFAVTFLKIGLIPGDGGAWLLPRTIGMSRASQLLFTGDTIDATTARAWGLVSEVVPHQELLTVAMALAERIALQPSHSLRLAKSLLRHGQGTGFDTLMEMSAAAQAISHLDPAHDEGVAAVLERRNPNFPDQ